jgi:hypothetical protein
LRLIEYAPALDGRCSIGPLRSAFDGSSADAGAGA